MDDTRKQPGEKTESFPSTGSRLSRTGRKYSLSVVGFVDTLGAKAFAESEPFMNALAFMVDRQRRIDSTLGEERPLRTTYFSDNIGASIVIEGLDTTQRQRSVGKVLRLLAGIQLSYLREFGILCRGGVAIGKCFHNESVLFGPALVGAYQLELAAGSPRIAVSADVAALTVEKMVPLLAAEPLLKRGDDRSVATARSIDFMRAELPPVGPARQPYLDSLSMAISKGLKESANDKTGVLSKWEWTRLRFEELKDDTGMA